MSTSSPYDAEFFQGQVDGSLASAAIVLPLLFEYYRPASIVDVGCGLGAWLKSARSLGIEDILGIDGEHVDRNRLLIERDRFRAIDLGAHFDLGRRFDLAISVEVAEHLPYQRAESFVTDLTALSDVVLFSAAVPFQGGVDHINEQWMEFWGILFRRHGYVACDPLRWRLWSNPKAGSCYSQNLLVFCREDRAAHLFPPESRADKRPLSTPHPLTFLINVACYRPYSAEVADLECQDYVALLEAYLAGDTVIPRLRVLEAFSAGSGDPLFPRARTVVQDVHLQMAAKDQETERMKRELANLNDSWSREFADLHASWSWRLTDPLRRLVDLSLAIGRTAGRIIRQPLTAPGQPRAGPR